MNGPDHVISRRLLLRPVREELRESGVSITVLMRGATATDLHRTAGMDDTEFGSNDWKNDPSVVAQQGLEALFAGKEHVVGGDAATKRAAAVNRALPEAVKARRFARDSKPDS